MSNFRSDQILRQFKRTPNSSSSHSKDVTSRLNYVPTRKEPLSPDPQSQEYAKSSRQTTVPRFQRLQETVRRLQRENAQLRREIVSLKTTHFFKINEGKIRQAIGEMDRLRDELRETKKQLSESLVEMDFLKRFNRNLTIQCQVLTREILVLKGKATGKRGSEKSIYTGREEQQAERQSKGGPFAREGLQTRRKEGEQKVGKMVKHSLSTTRASKQYYPSYSSQQNLDSYF